MKHLFITVSSFFFSFISFCQTVQTLDHFSHPESVLTWGGKVLVTNIGSKVEPAAKDSDGYISLLASDGQRLEEKFLPTKGDILHAPKGMALVGNILYVADVDRVVGFNLKSRRKVWELSFAGTSTFLNDLALLNHGFLAVSATDVHKIFLIDIAGKTFHEMPLPVTIKGPNGLSYDNDSQKLYVSGWGENNQPNGALYEVDLGDLNTTRKLSDRPGYYDGMTVSSSMLIVSDWVTFDNKGIVLLVNKTSGVSRALNLPVHPGGPADICFDEKNHVLWVPALLEGKVYRISVDVDQMDDIAKN